MRKSYYIEWINEFVDAAELLIIDFACIEDNMVFIILNIVKSLYFSTVFQSPQTKLSPISHFIYFCSDSSYKLNARPRLLRVHTFVQTIVKIAYQITR